MEMAVAQLVHRLRMRPPKVDPGVCPAWISRGWLAEPTAARVPMLSDLPLCVGLPGFEPGTS